ncbi:MAG: hypothetical protein EA398_07600 [Deltaproteobacteria bacterium]|nr:MAG: hypothetical protein EA398_07600 [Deltaproteobacteria bacterium]
MRRLREDHGWFPVREAEASAEEERCAETLAHLLLDGMAHNGQLQVRTSERQFLAVRDERGVLIGWASGMTPLAQRAAMLRAEAENARSSMGVWDSTQAQHPPGTGPRVVSGGLPAGDTRELASSPPAIAASRSSGGFQDDLLEYELVVESAVSGGKAPAAGTVRAADAASWLLDALKATLPELGSAVAANYWRAALRENALDGLLRVSFRGEVECPSPQARLDEEEIDAMLKAVRMWEERCRAVIPDFAGVMRGLPDAPWHAREMTRRSS